jgi:hypothetical protein
MASAQNGYAGMKNIMPMALSPDHDDGEPAGQLVAHQDPARA